MDTSNIKVLIADDVRLNIILVQKALSTKPFQILTASNGAEAIEMLQTEQPNIVLLDLMMPGVDGYEVIAKIRAGEAGRKDARIVVLSALNSNEDRRKGIELGADDYLTKPIIIPHLLEVVDAQVKALENA